MIWGPITLMWRHRNSAIPIVITQRTHYVITAPLWRQNDTATSCWRNNHVIITSYVRWEMIYINTIGVYGSVQYSGISVVLALEVPLSFYTETLICKKKEEMKHILVVLLSQRLYHSRWRLSENRRVSSKCKHTRWGGIFCKSCNNVFIVMGKSSFDVVQTQSIWIMTLRSAQSCYSCINWVLTHCGLVATYGVSEQYHH